MPYKNPEDHKKNIARNRERYNTYARNYQRRQRAKVVEMLGSKCAQCGYDDNPLGLDVDHVEGGGRIERAGQGGTAALWRKYLARNCDGLQLLCGTCHNIKSRSKV